MQVYYSQNSTCLKSKEDVYIHIVVLVWLSFTPLPFLKSGLDQAHD
jgi:hypothetical protein